MSDFDHSAYIASLDVILKASQEDYKQITYDRRAMQHSILRNYLWLATALFSAEISFFINLAGEHPLLPWPVHAGIVFYAFTILALCLSGAAFAFGIDTMRGRDGVCFPYEYTYEHLMDMAHKESDNQVSTGTMRIGMIRSLETAISHHREMARKTGEKLRWLSRMLLASLVCIFIALAGSSLQISGYLPKKEVNANVGQARSATSSRGDAPSGAQKRFVAESSSTSFNCQP